MSFRALFHRLRAQRGFAARSERRGCGTLSGSRRQKARLMCGIAGALARRPGEPPPAGAVELFAAAMVHRGPDGHGFFRAGPVALAHRRLSIIDLSDAGRQPMTNEDGQIAIVVNGTPYIVDAGVGLVRRASNRLLHGRTERRAV